MRSLQTNLITENLYFLKNKKSINSVKFLENERIDKSDNISGINLIPKSRFRLFVLKNTRSIQYIHSSGFGISNNKIDDTVYQNGSENWVDIYAYAISYTIFYNRFNFGFGVSTFSGESLTSSPPSCEVCYSVCLET